MSDRPSNAKWISKEERKYLERRMREEQEAIKAAGTGSVVSYKSALKDINVWKLVLIYFAIRLVFMAFRFGCPQF